MTARRLVWSAGVVVAVLALGAAVVVASALPAGYDFRAYWLAGQHLLNGSPLYPGPDTILGLPDEFRYLPVVALLFIPFAVLPYSVALAIWIVLQVATAAAVGIALIRQLPPLWRPWAAAGYVFFLGLVLEVTLGNVNLLSLGLVLAAWRFRDRAVPAGLLLAAAVGLKFLPLTLLLFYVASGRWRPVLTGGLIGTAALAIGALLMPDRTATRGRAPANRRARCLLMDPHGAATDWNARADPLASAWGRGPVRGRDRDGAASCAVDRRTQATQYHSAYIAVKITLIVAPTAT